MKVYIAGKLTSENEREFLEKIAKICEDMKFKTFLPHRDVGLAKSIKEVNKIFKKDIIEGFKDVKLVIANLNGLHVGAGTAWELGYAYANGITCIGIKTDDSVENALDSLSAILIASMEIVNSLDELREKIGEFNKNK